jgi:CDP-paratose 2-epimerase
MSEERVGMSVALITGSAGLVGAEATRFFSSKGFDVVGIDNDMRQLFFGPEASTLWSRKRLIHDLQRYKHYEIDIRDNDRVERLFQQFRSDIAVVIHTAAQPSHDWAAREPFTDFDINARGTLILLENTRKYCQDAVFIFVSTNKVYGDTPNSLPLIELTTRWEISPDHRYANSGIDETMSIDQTKHSLFGASKVAADVLVQEYGRYFGMKTACFRGGCLTGPGHSGAEMHGFLSYLVRCVLTGTSYQVFGYKGKQVRDNLHAFDLVNMFWHFYQNPRRGEVYNAGGGRHSNCSILEAITISEGLTGRSLDVTYNDVNRVGDHIWWVSDTSKYQTHYPHWSQVYDLQSIISTIIEGYSK